MRPEYLDDFYSNVLKAHSVAGTTDSPPLYVDPYIFI